MNVLFPRVLFLSLVIVSFSVSFAQDTPPENEGKSMSPLELYIHGLNKHVTENNKTTDQLSEEDIADLPIGIVRRIGNGVYVICIDSAYWDGKGWYFSAYASVTLPGSTRPLAFAAKDVGFNKGGLSLTQTKLVMVGEQLISMSSDVDLQLPADGSNFVEFDCAGFKSVNLKGNFIFSDRILVPDKAKSPGSTKVTASFEVNTADLNNIMVNVDVTPFKIKGLNDLSFEVKNATADYSDIINPPGFVFPSEYQNAFEGEVNLWRGFFLQEVSVSINSLANEGNTPPAVLANNMLIDDFGISGDLSAVNFISIEKGSANGWPFSVEKLSIQLLHNNLTGGGLNGQIKIPFLGDDPLAYTAEIEQVDNYLDYLFAVATTDGKEYQSPFSAKIKLDKGSKIAIQKKQGKLMPTALLHGAITLSHSNMEASGIQFQDLLLNTEEPYIQGGKFATVSEGGAKSAGFPVRIDSVTLVLLEGNAALGFAVALNFMNPSNKGFAANTYVTLSAKMEKVPGDDNPESAPELKWEFDKVKVHDIMIDAQTTAINLKGRLTLFDGDQVYGSGFRGNLNLAIKGVFEPGLQVNGYFGSKEDYRYWHLDAYLPTAQIPLVPPLAINGFIGGASYKMSRKESFQPDFSKIGGTSGSTSNDTPRNSAEEFAYVPDENAGLSFMAGVTLIAGSEKAFNSDAVLEVAFNNSGGIRYARFDGSAFFFTSVENRDRSNDVKEVQAPVFADLKMIYDNENDVFHANLKTYMNVKNSIRGIGPNNLLGEAIIHVDPKDWYIYVGRPSQMLGVDLAHLAVGQGYFMAGTQIEDLPLPPSEVQDVFEDINPQLMRDENLLARGLGFAIGARFQTGFDTKNRISPLYGAFTVGAGADMMIRDFGETYCIGYDDAIGINGWYASGQAYVFLNGKVGIKVKGKKFDFLKLGAAALLQAKLPNPSWLKGSLAGKYSVMGGLVKGSFDVDLIVGEECELSTQGNEIGDILVISDLKPEASLEDVNVFAAPQVSFNTSVNTEFVLLNTRDEVNTYRIKLDEFAVYKGNDKLPADMEWNGQKDAILLRTKEILPPETTLRAFVKLHWEKKTETNQWEAIKVDGQVDYEIRESAFVTGDAPDFIPRENVAYSYPIDRQYNLHTKEHGQGYVKLRTGQSYLFESDDNTIWDYFARFRKIQGDSLETMLEYDASASMLTFGIPEELSNESVFELSLIKKPQFDDINTNVERNVITYNSVAGNEVTLASNTLKGTLKQDVELDLYEMHFRTSKYATFSEKWSSISAQQDLFDVAIGNLAVIGKRGSIPEMFDKADLYASQDALEPLVSVSASPENNWLKNDISPLLYELYPVHPNVTIEWRNPQLLGVKPLKGVRLNNDQGDLALDDTQIQSGIASSRGSSITMAYFLSYYTFWDFDELRNKAADEFLSGGSDRAGEGVRRLLAAEGYTDLKVGTYPVNINYVLPGIDKVTARKQWLINF